MRGRVNDILSALYIANLGESVYFALLRKSALSYRSQQQWEATEQTPFHWHRWFQSDMDRLIVSTLNQFVHYRLLHTCLVTFSLD